MKYSVSIRIKNQPPQSGAIPQSKTGVLAKGGKTRNPNKPSTSLIIRKRK